MTKPDDDKDQVIQDFQKLLDWSTRLANQKLAEAPSPKKVKNPRRSPELLATLGQLIESGQLETLLARMLHIWPPDEFWADEDVGFVTILMHIVKGEYPAQANQIYKPFAQRLKSHSNEREWLSTLVLRARVVKDYEGYQATVAWLRDMVDQTLPPHDGIVYLALGMMMLEEDLPGEARQELRVALERSLHGIEWFRLEAINEMIKCQAMLENKWLAFEYAKAHAVESYKVARISSADLFKACKGNAALFGQLDFLIELQSNVARHYRTQGNYSAAAVAESDAALYLSHLGLGKEGSARLHQAALDADKGTLVTDPLFASTCRLLARYVDPAPLSAEELLHVLNEFDERWANPAHSELVRQTQKGLRRSFSLPAELIQNWVNISSRLRHRAGMSSKEAMTLHILVHLAALLARWSSDIEEKLRLFDRTQSILFHMVVLEADDDKNAISIFARRHLAECLLNMWKTDEALKICEPPLQRPNIQVHERFIFRELAARCKAGINEREAYKYAIEALNDWRRILDCLCYEPHKVAWLSQGEAILRCALDLISKPVEWMDESNRLREVFRLSELGKARIISDMINRRAYLPGTYLLSTMGRAEGGFSPLMMAATDFDSDWFFPLILQQAIHADGFTTFIHNDDGSIRGIHHVDLSPLRCAIQLPVSQEKRLLATAASLAFEESDLPVQHDLYQDLMRAVSVPPQH